ncbi:YHYH protein [Dokdonella sp.]|uniref:YHYH protein n=1 Tax=Dokdonella sp. TaxID=2291710 RepID=UPI003C4AED4C
MHSTKCLTIVFLQASIALTGCNSVIDSDPAKRYDTDVPDLTAISHFFESAKVVSGPKIVDCTLSGGARTSCFSITVKSEPSTYEAGPWCPGNIADGANAGGIWLDNGQVHAADGAFMKNLATFYDDDEWQIFDASTGKVHVTDSLQACQAAARPDVDPAYRNYCVQCLLEYIPEDATMTYVIPLTAQPADHASPVAFAHSGVASNGILLDGPAPVDAILGAHTIAPFDPCGGHVNPHAGYHYHAVTDCLDSTSPTSAHGAQIGIAMDGYWIFAHDLADGGDAGDLDRCNGHDAASIGYHYHAGSPGSNAILGCLSAQYGCALDDDRRACDASLQRPPPPPGGAQPRNPENGGQPG